MENKYPLLSDRIKSTFIDTIVILILIFIAASVLDKMENPADWIRITIFILAWIVYEPLCTALGATVGNLVMGIRVRKFNNPGKRINIFQAFLRYVLKVCLGWISFLTINSTPERRAVHDLGTGSVMLKL